VKKGIARPDITTIDMATGSAEIEVTATGATEVTGSAMDIEATETEATGIAAAEATTTAETEIGVIEETVESAIMSAMDEMTSSVLGMMMNVLPPALLVVTMKAVGIVARDEEGGAGKQKEWALQRGGHPLQKVLSPSPSEDARLLDGMSMLLAMSNIQPCRLSKLVCRL
jgi:hypothetical protein